MKTANLQNAPPLLPANPAEEPTPASPASRPRRAAMKLAYFGVLLFAIVHFAQPQFWVPRFRDFPAAKITALIAMVAFALGLLSPSKLRIPKELKILLALFFWLCLTIPFASWRGGSFHVVVVEFSKVVVMTMLITLVSLTPARLRTVVFVQTLPIVVTATLALAWQTYDRYGRLQGVGNRNLANSNDLALQMVLVIPFCVYFLLRTRSLLKKSFWACCLGLLTYAIVATFSRGGFLALAVVTAGCVWEFGIRGRRHSMLVLTGIAVLGVLLVAASGRYVERLQSIFEPTLDETGSYSARRVLLMRSLDITIRNPVFGIGPGNFPAVSGQWRVTHNAYTQFSAEAGLPALFLFLWLLLRSFRSLRLIREKAGAVDAETLLMAGALRASLLGMAIGVFFSGVAYDFDLYFLMAYCWALYEMNSLKLQDQKVASGDFLSALGGADEAAERRIAVTH